MQGYIHSIETMGLVDGPGIRVVIFMQGCPLRCLFCHNPDTWEKGKNFLTTSDEIVSTVRKYRSYIENNGFYLTQEQRDEAYKKYKLTR